MQQSLQVIRRTLRKTKISRSLLEIVDVIIFTNGSVMDSKSGSRAFLGIPTMELPPSAGKLIFVKESGFHKRKVKKENMSIILGLLLGKWLFNYNFIRVGTLTKYIQPKKEEEMAFSMEALGLFKHSTIPGKSFIEWSISALSASRRHLFTNLSEYWRQEAGK